MNTNNKEEENLLIIIRNNPILGRCVFEMLDIAGEDLGNIELADDAEEAVIKSIDKTGKELLTIWAQKKANQLAEQTKLEIGTRMHEKKT